MIHYKNNSEAFEELLGYVKHNILNQQSLVLGSDTGSEIIKAVGKIFPDSIHLYCTRHVRQSIERKLIKTQVSLENRQKLLELIFDLPESIIQATTDDEFESRLTELDELWDEITSGGELSQDDRFNFHEWFVEYQGESFQQHMIAAVRTKAGYVNRDDTPRLFYNNDNEGINYALKNETNWDFRPLSDIIDLIEKVVTSQTNETIRALYESGEFQLISPFTRFVHDTHIWSNKSVKERADVVKQYYAFSPPQRYVSPDFNIPLTAGRKPGKRNRRGTTRSTRTAATLTARSKNRGAKSSRKLK
ncbi:unnamed protein product [Didymodactylos carnosus]|uniref:Transposase n=1 Tax=Didymodactylos carnosus TaxID=1234261 RepID=A0A815X4Q9_9BILA|nr:unnamed protein product [Didymodactylos carnosus]CAF4410666.1 unnamed protein product [Didymodactylos carnosus]